MPDLVVIAAFVTGLLLGLATGGLWLRSRLRAALGEARTDPLTGMPNRRAFDERLVAQHAQAVRYGHGYSIVFFDLDGFKSVNDSRGHAVGDQFLKSVANGLRAVVRDADFAARHGGDEFAVLCPGTDRPGAESLVERLRVLLFADVPVTLLSASFGTAAWSPGQDADAVLSAADAELLREKRTRAAASRASRA